MRQLVGFVVEPAFQFGIDFRRVNLVVLALVAKVAIFRLPKGKNDVQGFLPLLPHLVHGVVLYAVEMQVGWERPDADSPIEPPSGHVVQHRYAVSCIDRVMQGKHGYARG